MFPADTFPPAPLDLKITFVAHSTLWLTYGNTVIHVDPVGQYADYSTLPRADIILVTHEHSDHLDPEAIGALRKATTTVIVASKCAGKVPGAVVLHNDDSRSVNGIRIEAVPAYNVAHMRAPGSPYHAKGNGNGYVLTLGERRVYLAGDTENTREMKALKGIDIAFLPMNLPYTMTPEMVFDAAAAFRPKVLYPYHFGDTDTSKIKSLLASAKDIEVRIRPMS
ncbi:MAG: MBL fold metallo-hydrolase [Spirochaetia bacterium]|jgi:L-ascorbate metabolism protein UlaG (beta-lactamase superfamily)